MERNPRLCYPSRWRAKQFLTDYFITAGCKLQSGTEGDGESIGSAPLRGRRGVKIVEM
jgi:hypothetical protein